MERPSKDPYRTLRTGSVPCWMHFILQPSLGGLNRFLDERPAFDDSHLALFQHGVEAVGVTDADDWREALGRARRTGAT